MPGKTGILCSSEVLGVLAVEDCETGHCSGTVPLVLHWFVLIQDSLALNLISFSHVRLESSKYFWCNTFINSCLSSARVTLYSAVCTDGLCLGLLNT